MNSNKIVNLTNPTSNQDAATKRYVDNSIPIGGIIMWSGTIASIPTNWSLCDGANGTPNLTNRFIIGASIDTATTGAGGSNGVTRAHTSIETPTNYVTGGSKNAVVVSHSHGTTDPGHFHGYNGKGGELNPTGSGHGAVDAWGSFSGQLSYVRTSKVFASITIDSEGVDGTNKNLPPYYALAFIMRVS